MALKANRRETVEELAETSAQLKDQSHKLELANAAIESIRIQRNKDLAGLSTAKKSRNLLLE